MDTANKLAQRILDAPSDDLAAYGVTGTAGIGFADRAAPAMGLFAAAQTAGYDAQTRGTRVGIARLDLDRGLIDREWSAE